MPVGLSWEKHFVIIIGFSSARVVPWLGPQKVMLLQKPTASIEHYVLFRDIILPSEWVVA